MTDTPTEPTTAELPGDPGRLHLTVTSEIGPLLAGGERMQTHRLLVRHPQEPAAAGIGRSPDDALGQVARLGICRIPMTRGSVSTALLAGPEGEIPQWSEAIGAVCRDALTTQGERTHFTTVLRKVLGSGPYGDLGDLLIVDEFTFHGGWEDPGLGVLLLGELVARTGAGPCVVAIAPELLDGAQGYQRTLAVLRAGRFRHLSGHTMVAEQPGFPAFSGPAGLELIRRHRSSSG
ncbi:hypothetical protein ACIPLC_11485 [Kitasatospora sp. NPDC086801]|uniref:hypothetical protein n=1 Tax=Kitasatospora sp. NPDC086801 TaxID=3364066 RepID=UPI0037FB2C3F